MKKMLSSIAIVLLIASTSHAKLTFVGKGDKLDIDPSAFPPKMQGAYKLFKVKCVKCHSLERTIVSIQTGIEPISSATFDRKAIEAYGEKMLRKKNSSMNKQEVKTITEFLNFLIDEAAKK